MPSALTRYAQHDEVFRQQHCALLQHRAHDTHDIVQAPACAREPLAHPLLHPQAITPPATKPPAVNLLALKDVALATSEVVRSSCIDAPHLKLAPLKHTAQRNSVDTSRFQRDSSHSTWHQLIGHGVGKGTNITRYASHSSGLLSAVGAWQRYGKRPPSSSVANYALTCGMGDVQTAQRVAAALLLPIVGCQPARWANGQFALALIGAHRPEILRGYLWCDQSGRRHRCRKWV